MEDEVKCGCGPECDCGPDCTCGEGGCNCGETCDCGCKKEKSE